jgi:hypothetical protein
MKIFLLVALSLILTACWPWPKPDRLTRWHELVRETAALNLAWETECRAKGQAYGLNSIGDPDCLAPPVPK